MKRNDWNPRAVERSDHNGDCKPGNGVPPWWEGCEPIDTIHFQIFDTADRAGQALDDIALTSLTFLSEDSPDVDIVSGQLVLMRDVEPFDTIEPFTGVTTEGTFLFVGVEVSDG